MTPPRRNDTGNAAAPPTGSQAPGRLRATDSDHDDKRDAHRRLQTDLYVGAERNIHGVFGVYQDGDDLRLVPLESLTEQAGSEVLNTGKFLDVLQALLPVVRDRDVGVDPIGLCGIAIGRHLPATTGNPRAWDCSAVVEGWIHLVWWHPPQRRCQPFVFWSAPGERRSDEAEATDQILKALNTTAEGPAAATD